MRQFKIHTLLFLFIGIQVVSFGQNVDSKSLITGFVFETATGNPVEGAIVVVPEIISQITDKNGYFELDVFVPTEAYIEVSAPGYSHRRVYLQGRNQVNIYLTDDSNISNSEELSLLFDKKNKIDYPASVSVDNSIDYKFGDLEAGSFLQGKFKGLQALQSNGQPGSGVSLYLNGLNSLNLNTQPLIIVDGIIYDNRTFSSLIPGNYASALSDIDVRDIDNIVVMHDGTSIYGSQAANGVILINTLRAKNTATRINFHAFSGINISTNKKYPMMDADAYKYYLGEMSLSQGMTVNQINSSPIFNMEKPIVENWGIVGNPDYYRYHHRTDWQDEVFGNSMSQSYYLNVTGGNENALIAVSVGYLNQQGTLKNTSYERYSTRLNTEINLTDWLSLRANLSFVYADRSLFNSTLDRNSNPIYTALIKAPFMSPYVYNVSNEKTANYEHTDYYQVSNPSVLIQNAFENNRYNFFGNIGTQVIFNQYLKADALFGLNSNVISREKVFLPQLGVFHEENESGVIVNESQQLRSNLKIFNVDSRLHYNRSINTSNHFDSQLGMRLQSGFNEVDWGKAFNTSSDLMQSLGEGMNALALIGGDLGSWKSISTYFTVNYDYKKRYFLMFNSSLNGSSKFGVKADGIRIGKHVYGLFPSINAAWMVSSEEFMKNQQLFDMLKLRIGYTITGNDDLGYYNSQFYFVPKGLLGAYGIVNGNLPNASLKWETNKNWNIGADFSFLYERIHVGVDWYWSITEDLIRVNSVSGLTGFKTVVENDGSLLNTGINLSVHSRLVDTKDFSFDLGLNISSNKNKLLSSSQDESFLIIDGGFIRTKVGQPIAQFYGYKTQGVFATDAKAAGANLSTLNSHGNLVQFAAGDIIFYDETEDNIIDEKDMLVIGDPNPLFFGGLSSDLRWKKWKLSTLFTFSYGNDIYNALRSNLESMNNFDNQTQRATSRWMTQGQQTDMPKAVYGDPMGNSRFSDRWIEDGSFVRLKSATLSYELDLKTNVLQDIDIYITGNNLLLLTKYLGYDPEFSRGSNPVSMGIDNGMDPQSQSILLGAKISF